MTSEAPVDPGRRGGPLRAMGLVAIGASSAVAVGLFAWRCWRYWPLLIDDVYISLRYAYNLAAGLGPVYQAGDRVEGYTNLLLVLIAGGLYRSGFAVIPWLQVMTLAASLVSLAMAAGLTSSCRAASESGAFQVTRVLATVGLVAAFPGFAYWAVVPLETQLFTALATAVVLIWTRVEGGDLEGAAALAALGVPLVLLCLTRPEGAFWGALVGAAAVLVPLGGGASSRRRAFGLAMKMAAVVLVTVTALTVWRLSYYGDFVPNTFRAKVTGGSEQIANGLRYLDAMARGNPSLTLLTGLAVVMGGIGLWRGWARPGDARNATDADSTDTGARLAGRFTLITLGWLGYVALIGGDGMPAGRFVVPVLPVAAVAGVQALAGLCRRLAGFRADAVLAWSAALLVIATVVASAGWHNETRVYGGHRLTVFGTRVGDWLRETRPEDTLVAVNVAGALPWASHLPTLDMLGLNDREVARSASVDLSYRSAGHRRASGDYVMARAPQLVFFGNLTAHHPGFLSDRQLAADPLFRLLYEARDLGLPDPAGLAPNEIPPDRPPSYWLAGSLPGVGAEGSWIPNWGVNARTTVHRRPRTELWEGPLLVAWFERDREAAARLGLGVSADWQEELGRWQALRADLDSSLETLRRALLRTDDLPSREAETGSGVCDRLFDDWLAGGVDAAALGTDFPEAANCPRLRLVRQRRAFKVVALQRQRAFERPDDLDEWRRLAVLLRVPIDDP